MQVGQTIQQAEAIVRFTQEVDRRLAECGIAGAAELLALYARLRQAVEQIEGAELDWATSETERLARRLHALGTELQHLSALKAAFDTPH
jgi:ABC-type phosphate transport system auxiliary subunit